jgi:iron complex transport system substrate-binding protein
MKKIIILGVVVIAIVLLGSGWTLYSMTSPSNSASKTKIVVDSRGKSINITSNVQRLVVLRSGIIETLFALGAQDKIVGIDESTKAGTGYGEFPAKLDSNITSLPCPVNSDPNIEQIIALQPDVILIGGYGRIRWVDQLEAYNLTVVVAHFEEIGNFTRDLRIVGEVVSKQQKADELASYVDSFLASLGSRVGNISADQVMSAYFAGHDVYHVYGSTTFEHAQIVTAGGTNVADSITTWLPQISPEQLIAWNPDVIFTLNGVDTATILNDGRIQDVSAIKNNRVYATPEAGWDYGTFRAIFAIEWVASKLYPDQFANVNMADEANAFYQQFWGMNYDGPAL